MAALRYLVCWVFSLACLLSGCKQRPTLCRTVGVSSASEIAAEQLGPLVPVKELQSYPDYVTFTDRRHARIDWTSYGHILSSTEVEILPGDGGVRLLSGRQQPLSLTFRTDGLRLTFRSPRCVDTPSFPICRKYGEEEYVFIADMLCGPSPYRDP